MVHLISLLFLPTLAAAFPFPYNTLERVHKVSKDEFESSGDGPGESFQGIVKVVQLDPRALAQSGLFRRGLASRRAPSLHSRLPFPAFLSQARPGAALKAPVSPLHHLQAKKPAEVDLKKRQGLQMWQRAMEKGNKMAVSLPATLKDAKQTCTAVPFIQRVTSEGCATVTVHNKLCFGQCSSLFVPSEMDPARKGSHHRVPCSRCAPVKAHTVTIPLQCGAKVQERRVMLVEECKCETGREEMNAEEAAALPHF
ncbi:DAN domain family member 5 [Dunckerocampus dactyliophorus]|uniref:DAN domain family member 5 n=1 Tax=Dunckerocampus dactyliophorus TaxID=161453 RepID=UPI002407301F|nr:DAN domain family member 5 [Dunckerocampus dactyliophorus]